MKISEAKRCCQPVGKSKDRYVEVVTRDARRVLRTTRWKILALDQKIWGRETEEARALNWAVVDSDFEISTYMEQLQHISQMQHS